MANKKPNISGLKPFKKGKSGNPAGRPVELPEIKEVLTKIGSEVVNGSENLEAVFRNLYKEARKGNMKAVEILLDRVYGKVKQPVDANISGGMELVWNEVKNYSRSE